MNGEAKLLQVHVCETCCCICFIPSFTDVFIVLDLHVLYREISYSVWCTEIGLPII